MLGENMQATQIAYADTMLLDHAEYVSVRKLLKKHEIKSLMCYCNVSFISLPHFPNSGS